jgi:branched-chain amino acid transport system ATP-binding protein
MLEVEGINVSYGPVQALFGVGLRVEAGEMVALLGANGAGKTTTLRTISGLLTPTSGRISIDGRDTAGMSAQKVVRLGVAHLPEGRELFPELTVEENLRLGYWSRRKDKHSYAGRLEHVFELLPRLLERRGQIAATLSGGEQQMLAVARALMSGPRLLLVDELSLGLAPIIVNDLFKALEEVNREGTAVLLVEQFVHLALKHTSRAYVLGKGEVVLEGKSSELLASPELMAAYLGEMAEEDAAPEDEGAIEIDVTEEPEPMAESVVEPEPLIEAEPLIESDAAVAVEAPTAIEAPAEPAVARKPKAAPRKRAPRKTATKP